MTNKNDKTSTDGMAPISVGIAGLGRSGWNIHAEAIAKQTDRYRIVAAADASPERRAEASDRFKCRTYADVESIPADKQVELLVIATPSHLHTQHAIAAMRSGKHVVCEKPMALSEAEAGEMLGVAERTGRILTIFHNRRFEACFQKIRELVDAGTLGRIVQVRLAVHSFARRWDWQTLRESGGGMLNNTGPHFLDQLMSFFPNVEPDVYCHFDRALTLGDADDHCVVMLRSPGLPLVQMELTSASAYAQDNWLVMGTKGTLRGKFNHLEWKLAQFPPLPVEAADRNPTANRSYNQDKITWAEETWEVLPKQASIQYTHQRFYESLFDTLRHDAPLAITPQQVRQQLRVFDQCRASAERFE